MGFEGYPSPGAYFFLWLGDIIVRLLLLRGQAWRVRHTGGSLRRETWEFWMFVCHGEHRKKGLGLNGTGVF